MEHILLAVGMVISVAAIIISVYIIAKNRELDKRLSKLMAKDDDGNG